MNDGKEPTGGSEGGTSAVSLEESVKAKEAEHEELQKKLSMAKQSLERSTIEKSLLDGLTEAGCTAPTLVARFLAEKSLVKGDAVLGSLDGKPCSLAEMIDECKRRELPELFGRGGAAKPPAASAAPETSDAEIEQWMQELADID